MLDYLPAPAVENNVRVCGEATKGWRASLATWKEPVRLRHFVSVFPLGTDFPSKSRDPKYDEAHHGGIGFPIVRLPIPTARWRPDVLGIAKCAGSAKLGQPRQ